MKRQNWKTDSSIYGLSFVYTPDAGRNSYYATNRQGQWEVLHYHGAADVKLVGRYDTLVEAVVQAEVYHAQMMAEEARQQLQKVYSAMHSKHDRGTFDWRVDVWRNLAYAESDLALANVARLEADI